MEKILNFLDEAVEDLFVFVIRLLRLGGVLIIIATMLFLAYLVMISFFILVTEANGFLNEEIFK